MIVHFVLTPKYRQPVLVGPVALRLAQIIVGVAEDLDVEILASAIMPDHVHLFVSLPRNLTTSKFAHRVKGRSSFMLRREFDHLAEMKALWGKTFFFRSVGGGRKAVRQYVEAQGLG
jgi:putative transposase